MTGGVGHPYQTQLQLIAKGIELLQALVKSLDRGVAAAARPDDSRGKKTDVLKDNERENTGE